jgi:hypothetical protein
MVWSHWIWNTEGEGVMYKITITRSTRIPFPKPNSVTFSMLSDVAAAAFWPPYYP